MSEYMSIFICINETQLIQADLQLIVKLHIICTIFSSSSSYNLPPIRQEEPINNYAYKIVIKMYLFRERKGYGDNDIRSIFSLLFG